ncbi:hypothetical protein Moror_2068 [Moniliophthora roreri MCA 2997]|uniref:Uncharacterized protein n=2 Tax=Moniliophthora roreri TaxID=221103 RepID=V2WU93_MONRO|nr:hypothetical protein Moror_2068 [Moniliophthora roreri MCA 2997]KAI3611300.1 hypothetical protein WG66_002089 [Moniliophthora roreri]
MILTRALTVGQVTFILRVSIQSLTYAGLSLVIYIILASSPRATSVRTQDTINRIVGKSTVTRTSARWVLDSLRGRTNSPFRLLAASVLFLLLGVFASISDIGYLGLYTCAVPGDGVEDRPASIGSSDLALASIREAMMNGTDPATVKAYRCDSSGFVNLAPNITKLACLSWRNSTYADRALFSGLNTTDPDALIPRQLHKFPWYRSQYLDLNSYFVGPSNRRVEEPTIAGGIVVIPHDMGFRAIFGSPQLKPETKVTLDGVMALEVEMGCMSLGMYSQHTIDLNNRNSQDTTGIKGGARKKFKI